MHVLLYTLYIQFRLYLSDSTRFYVRFVGLLQGLHNCLRKERKKTKKNVYIASVLNRVQDPFENSKTHGLKAIVRGCESLSAP